MLGVDCCDAEEDPDGVSVRVVDADGLALVLGVRELVCVRVGGDDSVPEDEAVPEVEGDVDCDRVPVGDGVEL